MGSKCTTQKQIVLTCRTNLHTTFLCRGNPQSGSRGQLSMKLLSRHSLHFIIGLAFVAAPFARPVYADEQLVYVALPAPCRVLDTRPSSGGMGPLTQTHGVYLFGTTAADISRPDQNGNPAGCNLPAGTAAISVNMNLLDTTASGNIATWSADAGTTAPNPRQRSSARARLHRRERTLTIS